MICSALLCATEHAYPQPVCWLPFVKVQAMQIHFTTFIYSYLVYSRQCESYNVKSWQLNNTMRVYIARTRGHTLCGQHLMITMLNCYSISCMTISMLVVCMVVCPPKSAHNPRIISTLNPSQHADHMHRLLLCKISNISSYELKPVHQIRVAAFQ